MKSVIVVSLTAALFFAVASAVWLGWRPFHRMFVIRVHAPRVMTVGDATPTSSMPAPGPSLTDADWQQILTPEQFLIIRQQGTEVPFSSPLNSEKRPGTYVSADCGVPLFRSEQKYDSGTGWPSFWAPIDSSAIKLVSDKGLAFEERIEVIDAKCGGHLGHVFDDGPPPTGKRYCMNGLALKFIPD